MKKLFIVFTGLFISIACFAQDSVQYNKRYNLVFINGQTLECTLVEKIERNKFLFKDDLEVEKVIPMRYIEEWSEVRTSTPNQSFENIDFKQLSEEYSNQLSKKLKSSNHSRKLAIGFKAGIGTISLKEINDFMEYEKTLVDNPIGVNLNLRVSENVWICADFISGLETEQEFNFFHDQTWKSSMSSLFIGLKLQGENEDKFYYGLGALGPQWGKLEIEEEGGDFDCNCKGTGFGFIIAGGAGFYMNPNVSLTCEIAYRYAVVSTLKDNEGLLLQYADTDFFSGIGLFKPEYKDPDYEKLPLNYSGFQFTVGFNIYL